MSLGEWLFFGIFMVFIAPTVAIILTGFIAVAYESFRRRP